MKTRLKLLGKKRGMTIFFNDRKVIPCTVISFDPNIVTDIKTVDKHGYSAVQLASNKAKKVNKPQKGFFTKKKLSSMRSIFESRLDEEAGDETSDVTVGDEITVAYFEGITHVDVCAKSKGKGFQGVMKRHNFAGGNASHGATKHHRKPGSAGGPLGPARTFPGKKLPGHMGSAKTTIFGSCLSYLSMSTQVFCWSKALFQVLQVEMCL